MRLAELQAAFAAGLASGAMAPALVAAVVDGRITAARRLGLHRNHVRTSLGEALARHFPVVRRLLGPAAFAAVGQRYLAAAPPTDPCLACYGASFAAFLARQDELAPYPFMADVARLEWARLEVARLPAGTPLGADDLAAIPPEHLADLPLVLTGARLLATDHAADRLWEANQAPRDGTPDGPVAEPRRLLLWRDGEGQIRCAVPAAAEFAFLAAFEGGTSLGRAAQAALAVAPDAALGPFLGQALRRRILSRDPAA